METGTGLSGAGTTIRWSNGHAVTLGEGDLIVVINSVVSVHRLRALAMSTAPTYRDAGIEPSMDTDRSLN